MKKLFVILFSTIVLMGCSNDDDEFEIDPKNPVKGEWLASVETIDDIDHYDVAIFREDFTAIVGEVAVQKRMSTDGPWSKYTITGDMLLLEDGQKFRFEVKGNTLTLQDLNHSEGAILPAEKQYKRSKIDFFK